MTKEEENEMSGTHGANKFFCTISSVDATKHISSQNVQLT